ncbi:DUF6366 family protein [Planococcus soli]|uniref:DUF6366 family protein n=1 Tax=Planococcus soli TaxID=2666072 RepID=UPI00115E706F|nr:DUF6366 family protein [Planococcus soli]
MESRKNAKETRERLRQNELKRNPGGSARDEFDKSAGNGNVTDIAGNMGWKGMVLLILVLILGYVIYQFFFS